MYALTVLLCPSSHGAASPDYYHILEDPEQIGSFDFRMAVLDKLVASIDSYKAGATTVLGGDLLTLTVCRYKAYYGYFFFFFLSFISTYVSLTEYVYGFFKHTISFFISFLLFILCAQMI